MNTSVLFYAAELRGIKPIEINIINTISLITFNEVKYDLVHVIYFGSFDYQLVTSKTHVTLNYKQHKLINIFSTSYS